MNSTCIIQARMGSTRFPGKVLATLGGRPILGLVLERLRHGQVEGVVVATTTNPGDDPVIAVAETHGIPWVRGPEVDVLGRFGIAMASHPSDWVVRVTADCPLIDSALIHSALRLAEATDADYTSNTLMRTYPDGLDVEVIRAHALNEAVTEAADPNEREHVTPFVYRRPERFRLRTLSSGADLGNERWTVDTPHDLDRLRRAVGSVHDLVSATWTELLPALESASPLESDLGLRPAALRDEPQVLEWRNGPDAVRLSVSGRSVPPDDHHRWYTELLRSPSSRLWIAERDGSPVGQVRVDVRSARGTVSVVVDPMQRRRGTGTQMLRLLEDALRRDYQVDELIAEVSGANTASIALFIQGGYTRVMCPATFQVFRKPMTRASRAPSNAASGPVTRSQQ